MRASRTTEPTPATDAAPTARRSNLTIPNVLSFLRLATVPVFLWLFLGGRENAAVALYAVTAWTDFADGYIARRMNQVTELGKLLDPLADRVFIVALAAALVGNGVLPAAVAGAVFLRDGLVLAAWPWWEARGIGRIPVNTTGKAATFSLLMGLTWLAWGETTFPLAGIVHEPGLVITIVGAVLYWVATAMYFAEARRRLAARAA